MSKEIEEEDPNAGSLNSGGRHKETEKKDLNPVSGDRIVGILYRNGSDEEPKLKISTLDDASDKDKKIINEICDTQPALFNKAGFYIPFEFTPVESDIEMFARAGLVASGIGGVLYYGWNSISTKTVKEASSSLITLANSVNELTTSFSLSLIVISSSILAAAGLIVHTSKSIAKFCGVEQKGAKKVRGYSLLEVPGIAALALEQAKGGVCHRLIGAGSILKGANMDRSMVKGYSVTEPHGLVTLLVDRAKPQICHRLVPEASAVLKHANLSLPTVRGG